MNGNKVAQLTCGWAHSAVTLLAFIQTLFKAFRTCLSLNGTLLCYTSYTLYCVYTINVAKRHVLELSFVHIVASYIIHR